MTSAEVAAAAGISYRQLDWWVRRGFIQCGQFTSRWTGYSGSGCPRRWTDDQAARVKQMAQLVRAGYEPARAAELVRGDRVYTGVGWPA